jgi:uncharacterized protein (DUF1330 family)
MENSNALKRQLTKTISIEIIPSNGETEIKDRIWAINWFNYKNKWLYGIYNKLAAKFVIQVGGQLLFKGHNEKTIFGEVAFARHTLLIVTYPSINSFLDMLIIKAFQLLSLLRVRAVKDFVFGFTKRVDEYDDTSTPKMDENNKYLVFHYQGEVSESSIVQLAQKHGLKTYFSGEKLAQIKRSEIGKEEVIAPFFMDGILVFETKGDASIEAFVGLNDFIELVEGNANSYAAIFTRVK